MVRLNRQPAGLGEEQFADARFKARQPCADLAALRMGKPDERCDHGRRAMGRDDARETGAGADPELGESFIGKLHAREFTAGGAL